MSDYSRAAEFYDLIYSDKDYAAEAELLAEAIRSRNPQARTLLDVACGTGEHGRALTALGFRVDGVDIEPQFLKVASRKMPRGAFTEADMTAFDLGRRYDVVTCLFSAIGYARTLGGLERAVACMARHSKAAGLVIVEPWFAPDELTDGWISTESANSDGVHVFRMSRTVLEGDTSRLELEYLIGGPEGIERRSELHRLGLFTQEQTEAAFRKAGLEVALIPKSLRNRGLYIGRKSSATE